MKEKQIVQLDSYSCNVSVKQLPIVPSETKDRSLRASDSSSKNSGDALVRLNHTSKTATDYDAFARYSELCVRNVTPRPCNQTVQSKFPDGLLEYVAPGNLGSKKTPEPNV
ncbi:hypothetical protein Tco_0604440 [Tanacetum coccineum]